MVPNTELGPTLVSVIGLPGVGKSTLVRAALADVPGEICRGSFNYVRYPGGIELGEPHAAHPGTDRLARHIQPWVLAWLRAHATDAPPLTVLAEGDRLARRSFYAQAHEYGWRVEVIYLYAPDWVIQQRRKQRGSRFSSAWLASVAGTIDNLLTDAYPLKVLDATLPLEELVTQFTAIPAIARLRQGALVEVAG